MVSASFGVQPAQRARTYVASKWISVQVSGPRKAPAHPVTTSAVRAGSMMRMIPPLLSWCHSNVKPENGERRLGKDFVNARSGARPAPSVLNPGILESESGGKSEFQARGRTRILRRIRSASDRIQVLDQGAMHDRLRLRPAPRLSDALPG